MVEDELDDVIVQVTLDPPDIPMKTFPNSRHVGTWLELTGLSSGTQYEITTVPIIRSTMGMQYKFLETTVVNTPVFDAVEFFNATTAIGNLTINGSYDEISVSLNLEQLEDETNFTPDSGLLQWVFHNLVPGAQYKLVAKAVAGPWSREAEYLLNVEPSKPVMFNETLLPIGVPLNDDSSVNYTFYIEGRGQQVEYFARCSKNGQKTETVQLPFQNIIDIDFPRPQIGCMLLMRVLSYESTPFYDYSIYIGQVEVSKVQYSETHLSFTVWYTLTGRADSLELESDPPLLEPVTCSPLKKTCQTNALYPGQIFYMTLTPIVNGGRGEPQYFEQLIGPRIRYRGYFRTTSRMESLLKIKFDYIGFVLSWNFTFEPDDDLSLELGESFTFQSTRKYEINQKTEHIELCIFKTPLFANQTLRFLEYFCQPFIIKVLLLKD